MRHSTDAADLSLRYPLYQWLQLYYTGKLDDGKRLEDWLRIHVLGKMYDGIFLYNKDNQIVRSEGKLQLHRNLSREYSRVDFILRSDKRDILIGEEKPASASHNSVMLDRQKCQKLRETCLQANAQEIPEEFHAHVETLSVKWHGLEGTVHGSRLVY
ncbi:hypothetical protein BJV82DRAFT_698832 [Fennellomyces sp. T-0311]|nr:hypothetical protein BJV82DRAFT_698832 [Fennellomyces sp. T-0311]